MTAVDPGPEPPIRCPRHEDEPAMHPCGNCQDAREFHTEWERSQRAHDAQHASHTARERADLNRLDITNCDLCDPQGYRGGRVCNHDPTTDQAATRGAALAREALTQATTPNPGGPTA